ncbi:MAG: hypothetical protein AB1505_03590, partial [Candidatus Latescibacterota bacterium]
APLRLARRFREPLLERVAAGMRVSLEDLPARRPRTRLGDRALLEERLRHTLDHLRHRSDAQEIDAPFVATRAEVHSLVSDGASADPKQHRILRGWRGEFIGNELLGLLAGEL